MNKIKETLTALTNWNDEGAVRITRKESVPLSEECFKLAIKCVNRTAVIAAATTIFINADISKLGALLIFGIFFALIYFMMKD